MRSSVKTLRPLQYSGVRRSVRAAQMDGNRCLNQLIVRSITLPIVSPRVGNNPALQSRAIMFDYTELFSDYWYTHCTRKPQTA